MIAVCIATYQRPYRIGGMLNQLREQTYQDFNVYIWNNSGHEINYDGIFVHNAKENGGSADRFKLVPLTTEDVIVFLDDDEEIEPNFLEYNLEQYEKYGGICGWFSKRWKSEDYWDPVQFLPEGEEADYVGTGGMILGRSIFDDPVLQDIPEPYTKVEDLFLSALARKKGITLHSVNKLCNILDDKKDQGYSLVQYKRDAFTALRKSGWKLLKDG